MTCFWNTIINKLKNKDLIYLFNYNSIGNPIVRSVKPDHFAHLLIKNNMKTNNVLWQNNILRNQELKEHLTWIDEYDVKGITNGHLTSVCDPFLLLICELFCVNIKHQYNKNTILYTNKQNSRKTLIFSSNNGHFVFSR